MTKIFKVKARIAPELMKDVFEFVDIPSNMRNQSTFYRSIPCIKRYGIEVVPFVGAKLLTKSQKKTISKTLEEFQIKSKSSVPANCTLNMQATSSYEYIYKFAFTGFVASGKSYPRQENWESQGKLGTSQAAIYLIKGNNGNARTMYEICSK